ncbi:MAG: LPS export ABC transporter permease LptF [Gammaproteobacteria bacterium]|nr:LPS export ABC transporter permease LptF [Gammaproteobacteria bacterium]
MIILRYIGREISVTLLGILLVLLLIYMGDYAIRLLDAPGEAAMPPLVVLQILLYKAIGALIFLVPLALFLSVMIGLGRLYKDSEMTALAACGVSIRSTYLAVGGLSVLVACFVALVSLWGAPWAEEQSYRLQDRESARGELGEVAVGRFLQFEQAGGVLYAARHAASDQSMEQIFINGTLDAQPVLLYARTATYVTDEGSGVRYLILQDGQRYEGRAGDPTFRITEFKRHAIRLPDVQVHPSERKHFARQTLALWQSGQPADWAELQWRVSMPLAALLLAIFAVPFSYSSPRQGKYAKLFGAVIVYAIYGDLIGMSQSWAARGIIPVGLGVWWVHGLMVIAIALMLIRRYGLYWLFVMMFNRMPAR